jgi:hypothetical protein
MRAALLLALALCGCATYDVHQLRDPMAKHTLIGTAVPDLVNCMGTDYTFKQVKADEGVLQYTRKDTSDGLKASVTLIGSVQIGGGGGCSVAFDVLRDGTVADVHFPNVYNDQLFSEPYAPCRALIKECVSYAGNTGIPKGFDAFVYLDPTAKKP